MFRESAGKSGLSNSSTTFSAINEICRRNNKGPLVGSKRTNLPCANCPETSLSSPEWSFRRKAHRRPFHPTPRHHRFGLRHRIYRPKKSAQEPQPLRGQCPQKQARRCTPPTQGRPQQSSRTSKLKPLPTQPAFFSSPTLR